LKTTDVIMTNCLQRIRTTNATSFVPMAPKMPDGSHLEFRKMLIAPNLIGRCKNRNRKLIRVTSSNERQEWKGDSISDYKRHLNQILYIA